MEAVKVTAGSVLSEIVDKVSFANYLPTLMKATADDDVATPGYMFNEITDISFQPSPYCQQLTDYLTRRIENPSACVKLKVLKIIYYVMKNGNIIFRQNLRRNDSSIKMATMFNGLPDPLLGMSAYEMVRHKAQELLDLLYDPEVMQNEETEQTPQSERLNLHLGGLGYNTASSSRGKYQGFGSSPRDKEETVKEKMIDIIDNLMNPVDETASAIKSAFTSSPGDYEPIVVPQMDDCKLDTPTEGLPVLQAKSHVPGKAGGGWESEEEEPSSLRRSSYDASIESIEKIDVSLIEDDTAEKQTVDAFCKVDEWPVSLTLLNKTVIKCASLNCIQVLKVIADILQQTAYSDISKSRALLIVEAFLRKDFVSLSLMMQHLSKPLDSIISSGANAHFLQIKARKIRLVMNRLSSMISG